MFEKRIGGHTDGINVTFEVYDSVNNFTMKEWHRVICLFSNGEMFQFKDWPPQENDMDPRGRNSMKSGGPAQMILDSEKQTKIVNIFHRVKGYYLHY